MTYIPDDIMRDAWLAYSRSAVKVLGKIESSVLVRVIATAILAERQRCADIALYSPPQDIHDLITEPAQ